jgi:hypothetical protein
MSKRKTTTATDEAAASQPDTTAPAVAADATPSTPQATAAPAVPSGPVEAPAKQGHAYTIDNRVGYRKEDNADGKRQIRFADREGGRRPDDELLEPVRGKKPHVSWTANEKAWQARRNQDGLAALDNADQELRDLGRKRTGLDR